MGILKPVLGKMMAWSSAVGFVMCILALSLTGIPASQSMNGGRRLLHIEGTCSAFLSTMIYDVPIIGRVILQGSIHYGCLDRLVGWSEWINFHILPCLCKYVGMSAYYNHVCMTVQFCSGLLIGVHLQVI